MMAPDVREKPEARAGRLSEIGSGFLDWHPEKSGFATILDTRGQSFYISRERLIIVSGEFPMNVNKSLSWVAVFMFALGVVPSIAFAQPGAFGGGSGPALTVVPPPKAFATADEHYAYLLQQAKAGTKHTITSVPRWDGLWVTAGNTHMDMFIDPPGSGFKGKVKEGVLTPPYEKAYKERWRQQ